MIVFHPRDNSYMGQLLDDLSKRSRVHAVFLSRIEPTLLYVLSWVGYHPFPFHYFTC